MKLRSAFLSLVVASLSCYSVASHSATITESEPNDTIGASQNVSNASFTIAPNADLHDDTLPTVSIEGTIEDGNANDVDFYCFNGIAGNPLFIEIDYGMNVGVSVDTELSLFDTTGTLIAQNDDDSSTNDGTGSVHRWDPFLGEVIIPVSGSYCVAVAAFNNNPLGLTGSTSTALSVGGNAISSATSGDSTFVGASGNSTGDYMLQISTMVPTTVVAPIAAHSIPSLSPWAIFLLVSTLGLVGRRASRKS